LQEIKQPQVLYIKSDSQDSWGGNQNWYRDNWQRNAGCGPTACSNLIWYLSRTRKALYNLFPFPDNTKENKLRLMEETWKYVTPGFMGVNRVDHFAEGAECFCRDKGFRIKPLVLEIPGPISKRPSKETVGDFLINAFQRDLPAAFLNLSNGDLSNLEGWHWVTLYSVEEHNLTAYMMDQGSRTLIDLDLWLKTTMLGGGFVVLQPPE